MIIVEQDLINLNEQVQVYRLTETGAIIQTGGTTVPELTQAQVENPSSTVFGSVSGQRIWQAIIAWGTTAASIFKGVLSSYKEDSSTITVTAGAGSFVYATTPNILYIPSLTQNTVIEATGVLTADSPKTLSTPPDTGGPWTLSVTANAKTKLLTRNGGGTATEELFLIRSNGTDLRHADGGGVVWSEGV